ncbi:MAG: glycosyltransferase [Clostridia bacterium]|nr:glycosyltransferase [Clostridia bacterium]
MPIISVIVPVYNVAQFLPRCVDSILAQSFRDFEVILVDDGSTDESGALCEQYAKTDSRIRVIHQENRGLSGARNTGIEHAVGAYLAFIDSDDFVPGYMLRDLLDTAEQSGADFVKGNYLPFRLEDECQCSSDKAVTVLDTRAALSEHF